MDSLSNLTWIGLLGGFTVTVVGLGLQLLGRFLFKRFGDGDTKEVAGVVGFRVSAIFGIAVGLIFAASAAYLIEAKRDLQEEVRLIATLKFLAADTPTLQDRGKIEQSLTDFASHSLQEMNGPGGISETGRGDRTGLLRLGDPVRLAFDMRDLGIDDRPARRRLGPDREVGASNLRIVEGSGPQADQMGPRLRSRGDGRAACGAEAAVHPISAGRHALIVLKRTFEAHGFRRKHHVDRGATCAEFLAVAAPAHARDDRICIHRVAHRPA